MARIKGYIDQHRREPALTPEQMAAPVNMSTRYLHKLFEGEHQTVALYLRSLRLQSARDELLDPPLAHRSIAEIAHDCGFDDISGVQQCLQGGLRRKPQRT